MGTDMKSMFENTKEFNQSVDDWNVSQVADMSGMFRDAASFNQCLSSWGMKTSDVATKEMLKGSACPDCTDEECFSPIGVGPWCQKEGVFECFLPSYSPSETPSSTSSSAPTATPIDSPPADDCKEDTEKIVLTDEGRQKCKKIKNKGWCDEKVEGKGDKTAAAFCTICGCESGGDPTPPPSPPDDCKEDNKKIRLTDEGNQKCKEIKKQKWCDKKVEGKGDKTAADFCTICGCESGGDPAPEPPDDCKKDKEKIVLTNEGEQKCQKIKNKGWCDEKVEGKGDKTAADFCTICGCESGGDPAPEPP